MARSASTQTSNHRSSCGKDQHHRSATLTMPSKISAARMTINTQLGCQASSVFIKLALKNGIMRCDTTTNTGAKNHQIPIWMPVRSSGVELSAKDTTSQNITETPIKQAVLTSFGCVLSPTWLHQTIRANRRLNAAQPSITSPIPSAANRDCQCIPIQATAQPVIRVSSSGSRARASIAGSLSHFGPAVYKKPQKNKGM